jgi:hypothetical protein
MDNQTPTLLPDMPCAPTGFAGQAGSRVLFLDFDGVILTLRTTLAHGRGWNRAQCDMVLVTAIRRVCETGVRIVVSSTWRTLGTMAMDKLRECGLADHVHEDWRTKELAAPELHGDRPLELREWLSRHPEVTDYRILDDDKFSWDADQLERWLVCDGEDGAPAKAIMALLKWAGVGRENSEVSQMHSPRSST